MNESIDKIMPILEKLAEKFNTTTDHLWEIIVGQAMVVFATNVLLYILGIIICIIGIKAMVIFFRRAILPSEEDTLDNPYGMAFVISIIVVSLITLSTTVFFLLSITNTITALVNPEYWALNEVFYLLK